MKFSEINFKKTACMSNQLELVDVEGFNAETGVQLRPDSIVEICM